MEVWLPVVVGRFVESACWLLDCWRLEKLEKLEKRLTRCALPAERC